MRNPTRLTVLALSFAVAAGCSKSEEESSSKNGEESAGKTVSKASGDLVVGKTPQIQGPLAALELGMDEAAARKAVPSLFVDKVDEYGKYSRVARGEVGDMLASASFEFGALTETRLVVPKSALDAVKKAWGEPEVVKYGASNLTAHIWLDEANGIRSVMVESITGDDFDWEVTPYLSVKSLASLGDDALPLNPRVALGATNTALIKSIPRYVQPYVENAKTSKMTEDMMKGMKDDLAKQGINIKKSKAPRVDARLPPSAYSDGETSVSLHFNNRGTVRQMTVMMAANDLTKLGKEIEAAFDASWGKAKVLKKTLGNTHMWYDAKNGVRASARLDEKYNIQVEFVRYLPLAKLFGEPGQTWGFEKAPIIGSTLEEIKAAYGDTFVPSERGGGHLELAVTDYDDNVSTTNINFRMKGDKVVGYYFDLPYRPYPAAKDEMYALLEAKFGKPKKGKRNWVYGKKKPKLEVHASDITDKLYFEAEL